MSQKVILPARKCSSSKHKTLISRSIQKLASLRWKRALPFDAQCIDLGGRSAIAIIHPMRLLARRPQLLLLFGMMISLSACAGESVPTPTVAWTPLPAATVIPVPTPLSTQQSAAPSGLSFNCVNDALFLEDLTLPDQTVVDPGSDLDKRWSVQNSGSCDWGSGYHLLRVSSDAFQATDEIALYPASAGSQAVWQVQLTAPFEPGEHVSIWQARAPDGALFGEQVYLWVIVATPMPTPTSRGTPTN